MKQETAAGVANARLSLGWVLGELRKDKLISRAQFEKLVFAAQRDTGNDLHPFYTLANQGWQTPADPPVSLDLDYLAKWLARKSGMPFLRIDPLKIDVGQVTDVVSKAYATRFQFLPVAVDGNRLQVATAEPFLTAWISDLSNMLRMDIERVVANPDDIDRFRDEFYHISKSISGATRDSTAPTSSLSNFEQLIELGKGDEPDTNDQHIVRVVDWLLQYAFEQRASDIHMEPRRDAGKIRFRIDGVLHLVHELPPVVFAAVTSRLKALGRMDVVEKRRPQDGRVKTKTPQGKEIELRLSTMPTTFGEKLVARIFDPDVLVKGLADLGFSGEEQARWGQMVAEPHGMILVTGPTGSGKTTTLYSALKQLARPDQNICTIEDPIENVDPMLNQMQVQHNIGLDFAAGVRTLLRQDPDIIMVGEIRDRETAETAIQAALTGHLVLSTLHTNDAVSAISRLLDLGVPAYQINASLLGVVAQRLVRTVCPKCSHPYSVAEAKWQALTHGYKLARPDKARQSKGCDDCRNTGYHGRAGIYEIITVTDTLRELIRKGATMPELRRQAMRDGMYPLRISGAMKVRQGVTTLEEIFNVVPDDSKTGG